MGQNHDASYTEEEFQGGTAVGLPPSNLQLPPAAVLMIGQRIDDKNKVMTEGQNWNIITTRQ